MKRASRAAIAVLASVGWISTVAAQVDWRHAQSPVKDQGRRGTCAAFSICALLETFPGVPTDLSEQLLRVTLELHRDATVAWLKQVGGEADPGEGDFLGVYAPLFTHLGTCAESFLPNDTDPRGTGPDVRDELRRYLELEQVTAKDLSAVRDGFGKYGMQPHTVQMYSGDSLADPETFKRLLGAGTHGIAVSYRMHAPSWANVDQVGVTGEVEGRRYIHPGMMARFRRDEGEWQAFDKILAECKRDDVDFVNEVRVGFAESQPIGKPEDYGAHAVLLVGYDERGFLAKNSWGAGWGEAGYCWISYEYHRLYAIAALQIREARIGVPLIDPFERTARIRDGRFRVKVQKLAPGRRPQFVLSTWMEEPRDCDYRFVEYTAERRNDDKSAWELVFQRAVQEGSPQGRTGAPFYFGAGAAMAFDRPGQLRLTVRIGTEGLRGADGKAKPIWHRRIVFEHYDPAALTTCRDLRPVNEK